MRYLKKENKETQPGWELSIPFILTLALLTVLSFCIPLRPTQSNMEKRNLAEFPEFSLEALVSGSYFDDITLWFSDTFPGREGWLKVASYTDSFHGYSDIAIEGDLPMVEEIPTVPAPKPPEKEAPVETTEPAETETLETEPAETEPTETEPTEWGGVNAGEGAEIMYASTVIQVGDSVFSALGFSQFNSDSYIKTVNAFAEAVEPLGATVVSAPPPTAVGILIEEEFQAKLKSASQVDTLNYLHGGMLDSVVKVDTVSALLKHNSEYVYFRTDHHWTARGAYYSYKAICEALDMEPAALEDFEEMDQGEFVGSLYGRASRPHKLKKDNLFSYMPKGDIVNTVHNNLGGGFEYPLVSDVSKLENYRKYAAFGTDWPMNHVENKSIPDAPSCLVIKDSFGNCFVPFLTQNFSNIYAVDYRKFREIPLTKFVEDYGIDYVLFTPYLMATQSGDGYKMINDLCF